MSGKLRQTEQLYSRLAGILNFATATDRIRLSLAGDGPRFSCPECSSNSMRFFNWPAMLSLALLVGCAGSSLTVRGVDVGKAPTSVVDQTVILDCAEQMEESVARMRQLWSSSSRKADFLSPREHDLLERLLANYLSCRRQLELVPRSASSREDLNREAHRCKLHSDLELVSLSVEAPLLWRAMNQSYFRSQIPAGSCDRILHEVTSARDASLAEDHRQRLRHVINRQGVLLPVVENELRHSPTAEVFLDASSTVAAQLRRGKNLLVTTIGRTKNPTARPLCISTEQRQQIRAALQPGDVLLTYTEGYASNLFIPGSFKHAATFVGTDEERRQAGLPPNLLLALAGSNRHDLAAVLSQTKTKTGEIADVVESVAEGVQLCNLDRILSTRINRLVVLRPQLDPMERAEQIADVMSYVGDEYDFSFDFTDASDQVCTEVVYRSLQGRGEIDLPLSVHAWRLTLTADDILRYCIRGEGRQFACILMVDESKESPGNARVIPAANAQKWLSKLPGIGSETKANAPALISRPAL